MMTRGEHLAAAKDRALEYVAQGDLPSAYASLMSDLSKHPELRDHSGIQLAGMLMLGGHLSTAHQMRTFIEGFH